MKNSKLTKGVATAAFVLAGLAAGTAVMGAASANAATSDSTTTTAITAPAAGSVGTPPDPSQPMRSDEKLLTGDTATKVTNAALAKYPDATIQRVETDSEGVYEAHIVTVDGDMVIVQVGEDFTVTGTQSMPAPPTDSSGNPLPPPTGSSGNPLPPPTDSSGNPLPPPADGSAPTGAPTAAPSSTA